jgi:hypothetical membrane protein
MVPRRAHLGAVFMIAGVLEFLVGMAWAQYLYPASDYSLTQNLISDLGCCGGSAHALVFNLSVRILGIAAIGAAILIRSAFPSKASARIGIISLALAGLFACLVGLFPEDAPYLSGNIHATVTVFAFFFSGLALVFLALGMVRDTRWHGFRAYTFFSGIFTWVAMGLFQEGIYLGIGPGGMERAVVAPILLWGVLAGVHLLRLPRYVPQSVSSWGSST